MNLNSDSHLSSRSQKTGRCRGTVFGSRKANLFEDPDLTSQMDERARQLADIASSGDDDNAQCAAADLAREFPSLP